MPNNGPNTTYQRPWPTIVLDYEQANEFGITNYAEEKKSSNIYIQNNSDNRWSAFSGQPTKKYLYLCLQFSMLVLYGLWLKLNRKLTTN